MRPWVSVALVAFTLAVCAAAWLAPAVPQPLAYHAFADARTAFGVPNAANTLSNVGFLIVGVAGMIVCVRQRARFERAVERIPYFVFFVGLAWTAWGSSYYHLRPDNERLFWDRLPMTVAFMGLIAGQVVDRYRVRVGLAALVPMLVIGAASVVYWRATERAGAGNVLPYALVQGYAVVIVALLGWLRPSRYTRGAAIFAVFGWYVLAKLLEHFDRELFALGQVVSGHALKHIAAALAGVPICRMLLGRVPTQSWFDSN